MYSPHSPPLGSTFGEHHSAFAQNPHLNQLHQFHQHHQEHSPNSSSGHNQHQLGHLNNYSSATAASYSTASSRHTSSMSPIHRPIAPSSTNSHSSPAIHHQQQQHHKQQKTSIQCLRFKYFTTFFVCTTCLALLSASLATHKWLVARPIRQLRLNNGQRANFTALMLKAAQDDSEQLSGGGGPRPTSQQASDLLASLSSSSGRGEGQQVAGNKFQGEVYFGLFNGVKVLNYGFGDRVSQLSVVQAYLSPPRTGEANQQQQVPQEPLVNFKLWLATLVGVALAILFALVGSIFAIINFVMTPRGTITGPVGLVIWNAAACFSCLLAMFAWLIEYFLRLKANVLTHEEIQNGWSSENRSQFGYSYYFVVLAFVLHLVNIFIVSIVQSETWTNSSSCNKVAKRHSGSVCDGVIMLY